MLFPDKVKIQDASSVKRRSEAPQTCLPKGLKQDTFRVFPEFGSSRGGSMFCNLPFRIALTSALALNLAPGPTILNAQHAPADVPTLTIRANTRLVVADLLATHQTRQPA